MLVSQAKGRELVLRGVALHQQDATDQEGSQKRSPLTPTVSKFGDLSSMIAMTAHCFGALSQVRAIGHSVFG